MYISYYIVFTPSFWCFLMHVFVVFQKKKKNPRNFDPIFSDVEVLCLTRKEFELSFRMCYPDTFLDKAKYTCVRKVSFP